MIYFFAFESQGDDFGNFLLAAVGTTTADDRLKVRSPVLVDVFVGLPERLEYHLELRPLDDSPASVGAVERLFHADVGVPLFRRVVHASGVLLAKP